MIQGEPKWWKVLLKEPSAWLIIISLIAIGGSLLTVSIFEKVENAKPKTETSPQKL